MTKRKRRTFTPEFIVESVITFTPDSVRLETAPTGGCADIFGLYYKTEVVLEALTGESSQAELCRRHNLSEDQLSKWKQQFLENAVSVSTSTDKQSSEDAERIAHLERLVGRMAVAMDIEKKH